MQRLSDLLAGGRRSESQLPASTFPFGFSCFASRSPPHDSGIHRFYVCLLGIFFSPTLLQTLKLPTLNTQKPVLSLLRFMRLCAHNDSQSCKRCFRSAGHLHLSSRHHGSQGLMCITCCDAAQCQELFFWQRHLLLQYINLPSLQNLFLSDQNSG